MARFAPTLVHVLANEPVPLEPVRACALVRPVVVGAVGRRGAQAELRVALVDVLAPPAHVERVPERAVALVTGPDAGALRVVGAGGRVVAGVGGVVAVEGEADALEAAEGVDAGVGVLRAEAAHVALVHVDAQLPRQRREPVGTPV